MALREKYLQYFVYLMVPLEFLPFLFEQDSLCGKVLLLLKILFVAFLFILNLDRLHKKELVIIGLSAISMIVTVILKRGAGVLAIILTLFMLWEVLPLINLTTKNKRRLFLMLACGAMLPVIYGMIFNVRNNGSLFDFHNSIYNSNSYGLLLLSTMFYLWVYFDLKCRSKRTNYTAIAVVSVAALILAMPCAMIGDTYENLEFRFREH